MKAGSCILMIILCILMIQPMFSNAVVEPAVSCCSKSSCDKPDPTDGKNDCENNRCNPLMSCPTGNFYLIDNSHISLTTFIQSKQKIVLVNDNRVLTQLTECWHPPEII